MEGVFMTGIWIVAAIIAWIGVPLGLFLFGRGVLRALNRRSVAESQVAEINERLRKLEERVEEVGSDNLRLAEAHQFATALLAKQHEGIQVRT
jgi:hypothetical protein